MHDIAHVKDRTRKALMLLRRRGSEQQFIGRGGKRRPLRSGCATPASNAASNEKAFGRRNATLTFFLHLLCGVSIAWRKKSQKNPPLSCRRFKAGLTGPTILWQFSIPKFRWQPLCGLGAVTKRAGPTENAKAKRELVYETLGSRRTGLSDSPSRSLIGTAAVKCKWLLCENYWFVAHNRL